jgi:dTDP-4-dehydrorhamnose reductase
VRSLDDVLAALVPAEPDLILHCAAMTKVDDCEREPQRAAETNVLGSFNVAMAAQRTGALLVTVSTDYVFDGEQDDPYDEHAVPNPISTYARTKYAGELAARAVAPDVIVLRTAWVFGAGDDFFSRAVAALAAGEEIGGIVDQVGSPTFIRELAARILPVVETGIRGVVHLAGPEACTWFDGLTRAKAIGDLPGEVVPRKAAELERPAPRPRNSAITSVVLPGTGVAPMPPLDESIRQVVDRVRG